MPQAVAAGAGRRRRRGRARRPGLSGRRLSCACPTCAARWRWPRPASIRGQPETRRRRHRHQRQELGRRLRPPALRGPRLQVREPRHARRHHLGRRRLRLPDDARSDHPARDPRQARRATASPRLAMEASSHGIDQRRLDGVRLAAAGFTNLGRDHLDYHGTTEAYAAAKLRLFETLLPADAPAVINADGAYADVFLAARAPARPAGCSTTGRARRRRCASSTRAPDGLRPGARRSRPSAERIEVEPAAARAPSRSRTPSSPRALCSPSKARAGPSEVLRGLRRPERRAGPPGAGRRGRRRPLHRRLRPQARCAGACARRAAALRAGQARLRLRLRRRPRPGQAAADGPDRRRKGRHRRSSPTTIRAREDPAAIRAEILAGAPGAREIGDRAEAIRTAVSELRPASAGRGRQGP